MEEAYSNLNNAYLQIKGMIVVEGFYALVAVCASYGTVYRGCI